MAAELFTCRTIGSIQHRFAISWTVALSLAKLSAMNLLLGAVNDEGRNFVV